MISMLFKYCQASLQSILQAQTKIVGILSKPPKTTPNLPYSESRAFKYLRDNEDIIILPADKGRAKVIMDKDDYNSKMMNMLILLQA